MEADGSGVGGDAEGGAHGEVADAGDDLDRVLGGDRGEVELVLRVRGS